MHKPLSYQDDGFGNLMFTTTAEVDLAMRYYYPETYPPTFKAWEYGPEQTNPTTTTTTKEPNNG